MHTTHLLNIHLTQLGVTLNNNPVLSRILFIALPILLALGAALLTGNAAYAMLPGGCGGGCGA